MDGESATPGKRTGKREASPESARGRARLTPMLAQYMEIKREHPDALLFYRMGDFYELFFDDAVAAAGALDITLTRRGKLDGEDVPMCGVPVHSHDGYLERLIRGGFKVAICEQTEDPAESRKRGKALVERAVVRVVTPGTLIEDSLLDARAHNHLAALTRAGGRLGLAWIDISTGGFTTAAPEADRLAALLAQVSPGELLVSERLLEEPALFETFGEAKRAITPLPSARFDSAAGERRLCRAFGVASLDGFGAFERAEIAAAGAVIDYVELTQKGRLPRLSPPRRQEAASVMTIDSATRSNLELLVSVNGTRAGALLGVVDRTRTGAGARLLAARIAAPLTDPRAIGRRLDMVESFVDDAERRAEVRATLGRCPDIERALGRLSLGRSGPRDLAAIGEALARARHLRSLLGAGGGLAPLADGLVEAAEALGEHGALIDRLERALLPELPLQLRDGGFIAPAYAPQLDEQRALRDESRRLVAGLQARYRDETGVTSLKVRHNNVLGYFVEVTAGHGDKLLAKEPFIHRQTLANAVRFTTTELAELEDKIARAADRALSLELALFDDLVGEVRAREREIAQAARALAEIDVASAFAELAVERDYCRARVDDSVAFRIEHGRHPVVEAALADGFVPNDCDLSPGARLWLLTGPNMAGKSTFLRQNALIAVLAQAGSFVPARAAHIGAVDRLFSRVGAADDLARGRSTFMVEMVETAAILNQAGPRALVILDEIGRGTATYDGLSIAWATIEHLHDENRCRSPGRRSSTSTTRTAAGRCSRPITTSSPASRPSSTASAATPCACASGKARWCSSTRWRRAQATARTAFTSPSSPGFPRRWWRAPARCSRRSSATKAGPRRRAWRTTCRCSPSSAGRRASPGRRRSCKRSTRSCPTSSPRARRSSSSTGSRRSSPGAGEAARQRGGSDGFDDPQGTRARGAEPRGDRPRPDRLRRHPGEHDLLRRLRSPQAASRDRARDAGLLGDPPPRHARRDRAAPFRRRHPLPVGGRNLHRQEDDRRGHLPRRVGHHLAEGGGRQPDARRRPVQVGEHGGPRRPRLARPR
jgi:DNA mismatch repair protein MutS